MAAISQTLSPDRSLDIGSLLLNSLCGESINITYNGRVSTVEIVDVCLTCDEDVLEVTDRVFEDLGANSETSVTVEWDWA